MKTLLLNNTSEDIKKAAEIGMLPSELVDRTNAVGNTSLAGCVKFLKDKYSKKRPTEPDAFLLHRLLGMALRCRGIPKQQRDAPYTGQRHQGIDDPAEHCALTAEQPGYQIKLENTNKAPVYTTDNGENQRQSVHYFSSLLQCPGGRIPDFSTNIRNKFYLQNLFALYY